MDWKGNRYFAVRLTYDKPYAQQMAALKKLPVRLRPVPKDMYKQPGLQFRDEERSRGYYHILVGCHADKSNEVLISIREIIAGKMSSCVELKKRQNKCSIIMDGKAVADDIIAGVARSVRLEETPPTLAVVSVGDDPASKTYVRNKKRACEKAGINFVHRQLPKYSHTFDVACAVEELAEDASVNGILVQLPLPAMIDATQVLPRIPDEKDVDHFGIFSAGAIWTGDWIDHMHYSPCTPAGIMQLLDYYRIPLDGKHAVIVGRSNIVGKPTAALLLGRNCTVTICHSKTNNLASITRQADILVSAIGVPKFVTKEMVKPGAVVIDVGINRMPDGSLCGDVDFDEVKKIASHITPVPGGVGPMTVAMLLHNLVTLTK